MALTRADHLQHLKALLPPGAAWEFREDSLFVQVLDVAADELRRVDERMDALLREADPRSTLELLPEWETDFGLPDPCTGAAATLEERRAAVVAQVTGQSGASIPFLTDLAERMGYAGIVIDEIRPFVCGAAELGAQGLNGPDSVRHQWEVTVPGERLIEFECGIAECGRTPFGDWISAADLECRFNRLKPSHTRLIFNYLGA